MQNVAAAQPNMLPTQIKFFRNGEQVVLTLKNGDSVRIGRSPECEVQVVGARLDPFHLRLTDTHEGVKLEHIVQDDIDSDEGISVERYEPVIFLENEPIGDVKIIQKNSTLMVGHSMIVIIVAEKI